MWEFNFILDLLIYKIGNRTNLERDIFTGLYQFFDTLVVILNFVFFISFFLVRLFLNEFYSMILYAKIVRTEQIRIGKKIFRLSLSVLYELD